MTPEEQAEADARKLINSAEDEFALAAGLAQHVTQAIREAVAAEREACALTAEFSIAHHGHAEYVAAEIRARK